MIIKNIQKFLSVAFVVTLLTTYLAPLSVYAATANNYPKPVLRDTASINSTGSQPLKLEGDISITKGNQKVTLSLRDSDVKQVLRMFADRAGLNIIFHDSVKDDQKVTLDMVNISLNDAFKLIMQVSNLTYYIQDNTMIIAAADSAQKLNLSKQDMMTIPVKYVSANIIADFLNKNIFAMNKPGLSNSQIVITNPSKNELLVFGTQNDYLMAKRIVERFDTKPLEEVFVVNHTTPDKMADMLCNVLFKDAGSGGGGGGGGGSSGGGGSKGGMTGGAAAAGGNDINIGEYTVACQYNNSSSAGTLSSLNETSLTIGYFLQRGTISVMGGTPQQMQLIKDFIEKNDKKQPQAFLEVSIIELSEEGSKQFTNSWKVWSSFFTGSFNGDAGVSTSSSYPIVFGDNHYAIDTGTSTTDQYISRITGGPSITYAMNYIISNKKGRVLANPRIIITNGQTSTIDLKADYVKSTSSSALGTVGATGTLQKTYNIASDGPGVKVEITPFISPMGYVTLNITPKYDTIKERIYNTNSSGELTQDLAATLLQHRTLELKNIRIKDSETLVLGGMITEDEQKTVSKIPVLGDLPGVGIFFRSTSTAKDKAELIIMITPKIIKDSEDLVNDNSGTTL